MKSNGSNSGGRLIFLLIAACFVVGVIGYLSKPRQKDASQGTALQRVEESPYFQNGNVKEQGRFLLSARSNERLEQIRKIKIPAGAQFPPIITKESEKPFKEFADWFVKYQQSRGKDRGDIEAAGIKLAQARLQAMARLIQSDPARALELALPMRIREQLPRAVKEFVEEQVNTRADYKVMCVFPLDEDKRRGASLIRSAQIGGSVYRIYTYGDGLDYVTKPDAPVNGIAVPISAAVSLPEDLIGLNPTKLMAMHPSPARILERGEAESRGITAPVALEYGGEIFTFSTVVAALNWAYEAMADESLDTPTLPDNLPVAESQYTEGRKRFLLMRVDFPDYQVEALTTNAALTLMNDFSNFMAQVSYSKLIIAPVGQGSDITPVMRMRTNASAYDNAGLSKLYPEARNTARDVYGYDLNKYDFFFVVTGSKPSYSYAGLGYVGGVGFHLANSYFDVRTAAHEFGHNLGLGHANWWDTGGKSMIGDGTSEEYGDPFDTMGGSGGGRRHYSSYHKNKLNWIPNSDCPTATTSGVYRLYAHDVVEAPVGVRGIRINRPSGNPYWLEFRQLWTDNIAMMNGISLRWASGSPILFDTTPGSKNGKDDHPLTIGRTFSDTSMNLHITPLRKAHTFPESLDVAIYFGPFPTNAPPSLLVSSSTSTAAVNQIISFTAKATDPNGDTLAYFWDFGDGTYSVDNSPTVTKSYGSAGKYRVSCTVSDLKGGVAHDNILITVENPRIYTIYGRVFTAEGKPAVGARVYIDSDRYSFSGSDGNFLITGLGIGNYTLNAIEPVFNRDNFIIPPAITVGPDYSGADIFMISSTNNIYTPIIGKGAVWKYLDNGTDQGTNWVSLNFDDSGWSNGTAILGYGEGNETTVIRYGPDANNKYITYYFRKTFNVTGLSAFTNLLLEVLRDDGVIVYINGVEVFRNNMPQGQVTYTTLASSTVEPTDYIQATIPVSVLRAGANVIAAEVHQSSVTSSDLNFDLALSGVSLAEISNIRLVYIDSPKNNETFEQPASIMLTAQAKGGSTPVTAVAFFVDNKMLGQDTVAPYQYTWINPPVGTHTLSAVWIIGGLYYTSAPVVVNIVQPTQIPQPVSFTLIPTGAVWYYYASSNSPSYNWYTFNYSHSGWASGAAELGYGEGDERTVIPYGPSSNNKWVTAYFRLYFAVNDPAAITNLVLTLKRDDGAIVYVNGVEVVRDLLPEGEISWDTLASNAADDGHTFNTFTLDPSLLIHGTNLIAVEIHQSSLSSSDLSFDLSLLALGYTNRPRGIWITSPTNNLEFSAVSGVTISADVVVGTNVGLARVDFYVNQVLIGSSALPSTAFVWTRPFAGVHSITAVATDTAGLSITSAPVVVTINSPPLGTALVSFGERWKYLDNGTDPGTAWQTLNFDDRQWWSGSAKFGYGGDGERTVVKYGTNTNLRYITTYFRKPFYVANPSVFNGLLLNLIRDDGAVVYINGVEVFRDNLLAGVVSFNSLALRALGRPEEITPIQAILPATLRAGTNVIAVEVHQASLSSSDLGFDLELVGLTETNMNYGIYITSPHDGAKLPAGEAVRLTAYALFEGMEIFKVEYRANNVKIGEAYSPPYEAVWDNPSAGVYSLRAIGYYGSAQSMVSRTISIEFVQTLPVVEPVISTLIPGGSLWKYWDSAQSVGSEWQTTIFNDSAWQEGQARFGWGFDGEKTTITSGRITHYFRRWFNITNLATLTELEFRLTCDDGAVVYVNGREVFRSNMPSGEVTPSTLASSTVETPNETAWYTTVVPVAGLGLVSGSNLVAVELHQASSTSSDGGFDLELVGYGNTEPRIVLVNPIAGAVYSLTNAVRLEADISAGSPATLVEFYVNSIKIGEGSGNKPSYTWTTLLPGQHLITARAYLASGYVLDSEPVAISVAQNAVSLELIRSNSYWRYLDDGSDQGTLWTLPEFDDSLWKAGQARLGYGDDGEVTRVSYGSNANNKYITTYFRHPFTVPDGVVITNLTIRLLRDDGAVVWLDGVELFRSNMPAGNINYLTTASSAVGGADEQTYFTSALNVNLRSGVHILAVEIHQSSATSSDLGFDLAMSGSGFVEVLPPVSALIRRQGPTIQLLAPAMYGDWRVYAYTNLAHISGPGKLAQYSMIETNGMKVFTIIPSAPVEFYRLVKP